MLRSRCARSHPVEGTSSRGDSKAIQGIGGLSPRDAPRSRPLRHCAIRLAHEGRPDASSPWCNSGASDRRSITGRHSEAVRNRELHLPRLLRRDGPPEERGAPDANDLPIVDAIEGIEDVNTELEMSGLGGWVPE